MIAFLQPLALFGLLAAGIPPLLHLISRRVPPVVRFPALRYLTETERKHSRRLKLRNLLLMVMRSLMILLIALAMARPIARLPFGNAHAPTTVAIVLDNSLSSGAIVDGARVLDLLADRARAILDRVGPDDRLFLLVADGVPRRVTVPEARQLVDTVAPAPVYLNLTEVVNAGLAAIADGGTGGEVVVLSDLQVTAFGPGPVPSGRVLLWTPPNNYLDNRGLDSVWAEPPVWSPSGQVLGAVGGSAAAPTAVRLTMAGGDVARSFGGPGDRVVLTGISPAIGWHVASVGLDPDELRADDTRQLALYVARPAAARAEAGAGPFVTEALRVLEQAGRARSGGDIVLSDRPALGTVILFPPEDPARVGAVNRDLNQRGVRWRFAELIDGEWPLPAQVAPDSTGTVFRRHRLEGSGTVIQEVGGDPWLVRDRDVILVGSRIQEDWTNLPINAGFLPFLDLLLNRIAARDAWIVTAAPATAVTLPPVVNAVLTPAGPVELGADRRFAVPLEPGVYFLRGEGADTVGALEVNHDTRESVTRRATSAMVRASLGEEARVVDADGLDRQLFQGARRADLTGILALLAILIGLAELGLATLGGGRQAES